LGGDDWTPAIGWRKALIRILWGSAAVMVLSLGAAFLVIKFFLGSGLTPGQVIPAIVSEGSWRVSAGFAVTAGAIGGLLISWNLVEHSSIMGSALVGAAVAGIALANLAVWKLGVVCLGVEWEQQILLISMGAAFTGATIAAFRIFVDS
jgi:hypothetical protein